MTRPILNIDEATYSDLEDLSRQQGSKMPAERYGGRTAPIGRELGARQLGYNVTVIAPGKRAYPFHCHAVNEEMFFVIEGRGEVRIGAQTHPISAGDVVACPAGGPETAHQIVNTGTAELKVLAVSTARVPEVCHYPDSGKFCAFDPEQRFVHIGHAGKSVDYWDGE
ncbi:cupin domain-containing protein [Archangium lipolyticum]|uniref:cupin domain-containing protein n=1 Tax=Archangium lipolyticum TaxID=2970465 RepID=UPI00214A0825|nr:cupin domain-containing protein [Archangium lipolyticum]